MAAYLKYNNGDDEKQVECSTVLTIGRDKNSDIVLKDLMVSRNHAMIRLIGAGDYYLIDSGSSNGSYINKKRVAMPTLLKNGDRVTVGHLIFTFEDADDDANKKSDSLSMQETIVVDSPEIKHNTILVADIRGFTSISEQVDIKTLTRMMNKWFHNVSNAIFTNGTSANAGVYLTSTGHNNTVANNTIRAAGSTSLNYGFRIQTASDNYFVNNVIHTSGSASNYGMRIFVRSHNNVFDSNTISTSGGLVSYGIVTSTHASRTPKLSYNNTSE